MSVQVPIGGSVHGLGAEVPLTVELTTGGVQVTCVAAPGWSASARTVQQLAQALRQGWQEAAVARYAARRGEPYDRVLHDDAADEVSRSGRVQSLPVDADARDRMISGLACSVVPLTSSGGRVTGTTHDPLAWRPLPDGRWVSPTGRAWGAQTQVVRQVVAKRAAMGVGTAGVRADQPA